MLSLEEARNLMIKYDLGERATGFCYRDFLRHFILTLKPQEESLLRRPKIPMAKLPVNYILIPIPRYTTQQCVAESN